MFSEISRLRQRIGGLERDLAAWEAYTEERDRTYPLVGALVQRDEWAKAWKAAAKKVNVWYRLAQHENVRLSEENARLRSVEWAAGQYLSYCSRDNKDALRAALEVDDA